MMTLPAPGGGGATVVNVKTLSAVMLSGGSLTSVSAICPAVTVTLHVVPSGSGCAGVKLNMTAGDALGVKVVGVPAGHSRANALFVAFTFSLKLMTIGASSATLTAPFAGEVLNTLGAGSA